MTNVFENMNFVFFGSSEMSVYALEEMLDQNVVPTLIVTSPDAPAGRGRILTPPPVKIWAEENNIDVLQPDKLNEEFINELNNTEWDFFVVFAYGKILPQKLLDIPHKGTLNIHPSMLPLLRGPSPVRTAILQDNKKAVGISIIELDEKMDHGPIVAQARVNLDTWPIEGNVLDELLSKEGGKLLVEILPLWYTNKITPEKQEHDQATFCSFIKKKDGEINLQDSGYDNYLKYCAYYGWPGTFFFDNDGKRIKITKAHLDKDNNFIIDKVIPEGKKEMNYKNN